MDERLKELQAKLANGEITQEQYNTMYNQISNPFEVDFVNDWMNAQLNNGVPLNMEQAPPVEPNYQQRLQDFYVGTGINTSTTPQTNPSDKPSTFFNADYNSDNIPDYLQNTDFGEAEQTQKRRTDFETDQEYYDYLKSRGVSDSDISELNLKLGQQPTSVMDEFNKFIPFLNPYGSNIETELYSLGRFAGMDKGTQGRNLGIASSALSAGLGGARTLLSGLAQQKQTELSAEEIRRQLAQKNYTQQVQYMNQNSRGGTTN